MVVLGGSAAWVSGISVHADTMPRLMDEVTATVYEVTPTTFVPIPLHFGQPIFAIAFAADLDGIRFMHFKVGEYPIKVWSACTRIAGCCFLPRNCTVTPPPAETVVQKTPVDRANQC